MKTWLLRYALHESSPPPDGALASFGWSQARWRQVGLFIAAGALLYVWAAQHWLMFALQLWLGYAGAALALMLLHRHRGASPRGWLIAGAALLGVALGTVVSMVLWYATLGSGVFRWAMFASQWWPPVLFGLSVAGYALVRDFVRSARAAAIRAQVAMERQRQEAAKQAAEAQLRLLQAQVEPHFLLNTLANVRSLIKRDADLARDVLDHLSDYLHVALPRMRREQSTLGREVKLSESYLSIMRIRMGTRLRYHVEMRPSASAARFPPMILQTIVENAVKHGVEPSAEPCEIRITAAVEGADGAPILCLTVADTGVGFGAAQTAGTGIGLANIRERLKALYGGKALLEIAPNQPRGVLATLTIPFELVEEETDA
jgi:signal transduction histidine kinase